MAAVDLWMGTANLGGASSTSIVQEAEGEDSEGDTEDDSEEDCVC